MTQENRMHYFLSFSKDLQGKGLTAKNGHKNEETIMTLLYFIYNA